jgi:hypothetical protein
MATGSKRPPFAMPLRGRTGDPARFGGRDVSSRLEQAREARFLMLVAGLALAAFALVFAWSWLPAWSSSGEVHVSKRMQQLAAMKEPQMQRVVWPDQPGDLDSQQPGMTPRPAKAPGNAADDKLPVPPVDKVLVKVPDKTPDKTPAKP